MAKCAISLKLSIDCPIWVNINVLPGLSISSPNLALVHVTKAQKRLTYVVIQDGVLELRGLFI